MTDTLIEGCSLGKDYVRHDPTPLRFAVRLGLAEPPKPFRAVDGVDIALSANEALGLVGESGCGKSTLGRLLAGLRRPTHGAVLRRDQVDQPLTERYGPSLGTQMVFQDPLSSLDPRMRVGAILAEGPRHHGLVDKAASSDFVAQLMIDVGLEPGAVDRFPHQFSGGQRQRIAIARALSVSPLALICDEPVSALDVSIQAQILNLFLSLQERRGLSYLFISHDLTVVRHLCQRVAVMYAGRIVETADNTNDLFERPAHPYTRALLAAAPSLTGVRPKSDRQIGEVRGTEADVEPRGCPFHPRCPYSFDRCRDEPPELRAVGPGQRAACHLVG